MPMAAAATAAANTVFNTLFFTCTLHVWEYARSAVVHGRVRFSEYEPAAPATKALARLFVRNLSLSARIAGFPALRVAPRVDVRWPDARRFARTAVIFMRILHQMGKYRWPSAAPCAAPSRWRPALRLRLASRRAGCDKLRGQGERRHHEQEARRGRDGRARPRPRAVFEVSTSAPRSSPRPARPRRRQRRERVLPGRLVRRDLGDRRHGRRRAGRGRAARSPKSPSSPTASRGA